MREVAHLQGAELLVQRLGAQAALHEPKVRAGQIAFDLRGRKAGPRRLAVLPPARQHHQGTPLGPNRPDGRAFDLRGNRLFAPRDAKVLVQAFLAAFQHAAPQRGRGAGRGCRCRRSPTGRPDSSPGQPSTTMAGYVGSAAASKRHRSITSCAVGTPSSAWNSRRAWDSASSACRMPNLPRSAVPASSRSATGRHAFVMSQSTSTSHERGGRVAANARSQTSTSASATPTPDVPARETSTDACASTAMQAPAPLPMRVAACRTSRATPSAASCSCR